MKGEAAAIGASGMSWRLLDLVQETARLRVRGGFELRGEHRLEGVVGLDGNSAVAQGGVRPHHEPVGGLPKGVDRHGFARVPEGERRVVTAQPRRRQALKRAKSKVVEEGALGFRPGGVHSVEKRAPADGACGETPADGIVHPIGAQTRFGEMDGERGVLHVYPRLDGQLQPVTAGAGRDNDPGEPAANDDSAKLADQRSQRSLPGDGQLLAPEDLRQVVCGQAAIPFEDERSEGGAPLAAREPALGQESRAVLDAKATGEEDAQTGGSNNLAITAV